MDSDSKTRRLSFIPYNKEEQKILDQLRPKEDTELEISLTGGASNGTRRLSLIPFNQYELEVLGMVPKKEKSSSKKPVAEKRSFISKPLAKPKQSQYNFVSRPSQMNKSKNVLPKQSLRIKPAKTINITEPPNKTLQKSGTRKILLKEYKQDPKTEKNKTVQSNESPLVPLEEADKFFRKKFLADSFEDVPKENISPCNIASSTDTLTNLSSGSSRSSVTEFEAMEELANVNIKKQDIVDILRRQKEEFEGLERAFNRYKEFHKKQDLVLNKILRDMESEELETDGVTNKFQPEKSSKDGDLRVQLFKKNLETPKTKKAHNLYNTLRKNYMLETPKFEKRVQDGGSRLNISQKLQEQCMKLFETPRPE